MIVVTDSKEIQTSIPVIQLKHPGKSLISELRMPKESPDRSHPGLPGSRSKCTVELPNK